MRTRLLVVPEGGHGMRLDRFLSRWFRARSRAELARGIRAGQVLLGTARSEIIAAKDPLANLTF